MQRYLLAAAAVAAFATCAQAAPGRERVDPDSDRDGKVTAAEFRAAHDQRTARLFERLDADRDGRITRAEAEAAAAPGKGRRGGPGRVVARLDADGDGAVTRAEAEAQATRRFQTADANKDGWLSGDELHKMRPKARGGHRPG